MQIDRDRLRAIIENEHSFYSYREIPIRKDARWLPQWENLIKPQLSPAMDVLDAGCGNGHFLLELSRNFHFGLGTDHDPTHIQLAEEAKRAEGIQNVDFLLHDYPQDATHLKSETFDMVVSRRGPLLETTAGLQGAH
jgi:SAM-dependent methyltransferase